jgi:hypothetical protein
MPVCRAVMSRIADGSWSGSQTTRSALVGRFNIDGENPLLVFRPDLFLYCEP